MVRLDSLSSPPRKKKQINCCIDDDYYFNDEDRTSPRVDVVSPILDSAGLSISISQDGFSTESSSRTSPLLYSEPWYHDSNQGNNELPPSSSPKAGPAPPMDFALFHNEMSKKQNITRSTVLQMTPLKPEVMPVSRQVPATTTYTTFNVESDSTILRTPDMESNGEEIDNVTLSKSKSNAWEIHLSLIELKHTDCCDDRCLQNMDMSETRKARILWDEQEASTNDKLLIMLPGYRLPGEHKSLNRAFALKVLTHSVCYKAFGSVYNVRRTHLYVRMREVKAGLLRFTRTLRTNVTDTSTANEIRAFMNRMATVYSEMMPHSGKRIIPLKKEALWRMFEVDTGRYCSFKHFSNTFDLHQGEIQLIQKTTQFSCAICLMLQRDEDRLPKSKEYNHQREIITQQQKLHFAMHMRQRDFYTDNMAAARNKKFETEMMILTDGMDQRKCQLPSLVDDVDKETARLECHIFGNLSVFILGCFVIARKLKMWIDFKQISHNSNQNLTTTLNTIIEIAKEGRIPRGVFRLQLDNTCSQNKNQIVVAFLALFVVYGIFEIVEIDYLPVGHTHNDIDRIFGYFARKFRKLGNPTLEQMLFNMRNSHIDNIDDLVPEVEISDETWAIDVWMQDHTYGLKYLAEYHSFQISKYPELESQNVNVGLKYRRWLEDKWSAEVKPLFHSLPVGKPCMELPDYKKIDVKKIEESTLNKLKKHRCLNDDQLKKWKETFAMIKERSDLWQSRRKLVLPKKTKKQKVQYVTCTWKEWGLDELIRLVGKAPQIQNIKENDDGYNEEHTVINQFFPRYTEPVLNKGETKVTTHQTIIQRDHVDVGKYAILLGDLEDCVENMWRPYDVPWVVRILSRVSEEDDTFAYCYINAFNQDAKVKKYNIEMPDPDLTEAKREYFDAISQLFVKSTGFNPSGTLKHAILTEYQESCTEATEEYDRIMDG